MERNIEEKDIPIKSKETHKLSRKIEYKIDESHSNYDFESTYESRV